MCGAFVSGSQAIGQTAAGQATPVSNQAAPTARPGDQAVARVNGLPITQSEVNRLIAMLVRGQKIDPSAIPALQANALEQLIEQKLILSYLQQQNLIASAQEVNAAADQLRAALQKQGLNLTDHLRSLNHSEASMRNELAWELSRNKYIERNTTDEALQKVFIENQEEFDGTERRVSHILFRPIGAVDETVVQSLKDEAEKVRKALAAKEMTFEEAVAKYSDGPSRWRGGDLGFIQRNGPMVPQFTQVAYALPVRQLSPPVLSPFGVHLIIVTEIRPGKKTWRDVRGQLQVALASKLLNDLVASQRTSAKIEYSANFPHFDPETKQIVGPQSAAR